MLYLLPINKIGYVKEKEIINYYLPNQKLELRILANTGNYYLTKILRIKTQ